MHFYRHTCPSISTVFVKFGIDSYYTNLRDSKFLQYFICCPVLISRISLKIIFIVSFFTHFYGFFLKCFKFFFNVNFYSYLFNLTSLAFYKKQLNITALTLDVIKRIYISQSMFNTLIIKIVFDLLRYFITMIK